MLGQHGGQRQVGKEQVGRVDPGRADFFLQVAVIGEQACGLLRRAREQLFQVFDDCLVQRAHASGVLAGAVELAVAEAVKRLLGRLGHGADTVDVNHLQGAVRLVQVRFRMGECVGPGVVGQGCGIV